MYKYEHTITGLTLLDFVFALQELMSSDCEITFAGIPTSFAEYAVDDKPFSLRPLYTIVYRNNKLL